MLSVILSAIALRSLSVIWVSRLDIIVLKNPVNVRIIGKIYSVPQTDINMFIIFMEPLRGSKMKLYSGSIIDEIPPGFISKPYTCSGYLL